MSDYIIDLFSVPVKCCKLNIDNELLKNYCYLQKEKDVGRVLSNVGGWQSNNLSLEDNELQDFIGQIISNVISYLNITNFKKNLNVKLNTIWCNINEYKDFNVSHIHTDSVISGVYYIKTPTNCGNIIFSNPAQNIMQYNWPDKLKEKLDEKNSMSWWLPAEKNLLYIFPSYLYHTVESNLNKEENRISLSFDISLYDK
jgi:uncharacterized protein (TIGR02466 family)